MRRSRPALLALATAIGLLLPGVEAARPQSITLGVEAPFGIDPHFLFLGPNMAAARHLYDSLIDRDAESLPTPGIVARWEAVGPTSWLLHLRRGVVFHDGSPFDAEDVIFSIRRIRTLPNNPGPYTSNLRTIREVAVVDPHTVRIETDRPNPTLMGQLTNVFIVSSRAAAGDGGPFGATTADFASGRAAIGTGPFRLERYRGAEGMTLSRNPSYWGPPPAFERAELRVITSDAARLAALLSGDVDLIENVPTADVARLARDGRVAIFARNSDRVMYLIPNVGPDSLPLLTGVQGQPLAVNPLRDLRVRQAISLAIDREGLVQRGLDGQGLAIFQYTPPQFGGFDPAIEVPRADPAAARRLLAEAGYPEGFGLTIGCSNNRYVNDARICQAIGQMLTRAGFQARVETQPAAVFFPRTQAGRNDLPLMLFGLSGSSSRDSSYFMATAIHTRAPALAFGAGNRGGFSNPVLDRAITEAALLSGPEREAALRAAARAAIAELPVIPLYNAHTITAARRGIHYTPRMDEQLVATHARPAAGH
ncbi:MAG: ABC transporter substrate-binding protein [Rhodovarius sp.]|nr:ABC transporter substrate-binding protein [Rhodovarius sp.]